MATSTATSRVGVAHTSPGTQLGWGAQYKLSYTQGQAFTRAPRPARPKTMSAATRGHFDPDELTRRLHLILVDQGAHTEKRRRRAAMTVEAKDGRSPNSTRRPCAPMEGDLGLPSVERSAEVPSDVSTGHANELRGRKPTRQHTRSGKHAPGLAAPVLAPAVETLHYHHVPQEAAKQFTLTTTADGMREIGLVHKLSESALRFHLGGAQPNLGADTDAKLAPCDAVRALHRCQDEREKVYDRNQFQRTRILEEAAELDNERMQKTELQQRHAFPASHSRAKPDSHQHPRSNSTGGVLQDTEECRHSFGAAEAAAEPLHDAKAPEAPDRSPPLPMPHECRVDWTQSDELVHRNKPLLSPLLRKADSLWMLRSRVGNKAPSPHDAVAVVDAPRSPKAGFFAKFKR